MVSPQAIDVADIDGDGDLDIVSASAGDDKIALYENNGAANPTFTTVVISTSADGAHDVSIADVDGDGDLDIVSASAFDDTIAVYTNNGKTKLSTINKAGQNHVRPNERISGKITSAGELLQTQQF